MGLKEDIIDMKKEVQEVKKESFAMEMLRDSKRANKRMSISWGIAYVLLIMVYFATVWLFLNYIIEKDKKYSLELKEIKKIVESIDKNPKI